MYHANEEAQPRPVLADVSAPEDMTEEIVASLINHLLDRD
jgi:hypothetical protein